MTFSVVVAEALGPVADFAAEAVKPNSLPMESTR
jgi:hypothetical protein